MDGCKQTANGKAFEYSLAKEYYEYLSSECGIRVSLKKDYAYQYARKYYNPQPYVQRRRFDYCAALTIDSLVALEPGLTFDGEDDELSIAISPDGAGQEGDVRDVVFSRERGWAVGISAKNNNDAVKHSRIGEKLDFGQSWFGVGCSERYWEEVAPVFDYLKQYKGCDWEDVNDKEVRVYLPLLKAFRDEVMRICDEYEGVPKLLVKYLIGRYDFYKVIKNDTSKTVVIKAFNVDGRLNLTYRGAKARYRCPMLKAPERIVEFRLKDGSYNTLNLILDGGWEVSFRIHNAEKKVCPSLKFDIRLVGNPPVIFTQYLFQEDEID